MSLALSATDAGASRLSDGVVTLNEPLHWNASRHSAAPAAAALRADYTGGRVLMQGFGNEYASFASRVPIGETIYEGSYRIWDRALKDPSAQGIAWIYMSRSATDQVYQSLHGSAELNSYVLVFDDGVRMIYQSRAATSAPPRVALLSNSGRRGAQ